MSARFTLEWLKRPPYRELHPRFAGALAACQGWPVLQQYDQLARQVPQATGVTLPRFVHEDRQAVKRIGGYEQHVAQLSCVPTRPNNWHDFFNMTVWAHFPKLRWELNSLHVDATVGPKDPRNGRAPAQNAATSFDETGMLVVSSSHSVLEELQALQFKRAFWERRAELLATTRFYLVGHGMLEWLLEPHPGLAARSLLLHVPAVPLAEMSDAFRFQLDAIAAERIRAFRARRTVLDPIPLLAIPGYCDNDSRAFYEDPRNLRFEPISRRPTREI